ncbi:NADP-dependent oxidoreductase [Aquimarina gracilis]|uniref:NADP-dependent oxidoreductase n=1 Tax=Aquimarina gracilis TaxID=874422 RepID=A0ABU5ZXD8_9FLAO|nr:NADP-dependent oxidoreductase [Aquimarina gracilis]MEB3346544.1 NADP-dependent oxidoreductase [Aquimarina gracilis]
MTKYKNRQWIYSKRPEKLVDESHYKIQTSTTDCSSLRPGQALLKSEYFSVDPYMRIQQSEKETWEEPHPLNTVQGGAVVGKIIGIKDPHSSLQIGDWVVSYTGWQEYAITETQSLRKLNPKEVPVTTALGILGMPARIAYFGLIEAGKPKKGETVVVSGASGAVGQVVVQIAKIKGCTVVGIAGSDEKTTYLKETLGVDEVINYKQYPSTPEIKKELSKLCPNGIDIYYDNVGGYITDAIFELINRKARIIICGQISQYSGGLDNPELGPRFLHKILYQRAIIQGVLARDYNDRMNEMLQEMTPWVQNNSLKYKETIVEGFENLPNALNMLFYGKNMGKLIVKA